MYTIEMSRARDRELSRRELLTKLFSLGPPVPHLSIEVRMSLSRATAHSRSASLLSPRCYIVLVHQASILVASTSPPSNTIKKNDAVYARNVAAVE